MPSATGIGFSGAPAGSLLPGVGRLALYVAKRHKKPRSYGWLRAAYQSPERLGLINLNGRVVGPAAAPAVAREAECRR